MSDLCFPNHVGLPGQTDPPTVDGYLEPEDFLELGFGTTPSEVDTGWTGTPRITYVADVVVGAGRPLMAFQGLKHRTDDFIYLSFIVRRDTAFDDADRIVLVFHPNFAAGSVAKTGDERRIDILPNADGVGAGDPGGPAGVGSNNLRANRDPRNVEYSRWDSGSNTWQSIAAIGGIEIKVRSWDLGVNNRNWSVEAKIPTTTAIGGADWINFGSEIGFYSNVIRICSGLECSFDPTPFNGAAFQFTWPRADYTTGDRLITGVVNVGLAEIPPSWLGEVSIGNVPSCSGVLGVKFQSGSSSIGVLSGGSLTNDISATAANQFAARVINTAGTNAQDVTAEFRIANWGIGPGDNNKWNLVTATGGSVNPSAPANIPSGGSSVDLTMQWQLTPAEQALYGPGNPLSSHQCIWVLLDSVQNVDFAQSSVRRNMDFVGLSEDEREAEVSGEGYPEPANGEVDHDFVLIVSQMRKGILVPAGSVPGEVRPKPSKDGDNPWAPGQALPDPKGREELERIHKILRGRELEVDYEWVWVTDGYRGTGFEFADNNKSFRIYEPSGSFGYIAQHRGLVESWHSAILPTAQDEARLSSDPERGAYRLRVPHDGKARVRTVLEAREFPPVDGDDQGPRPTGCNPVAIIHAFLKRLSEEGAVPNNSPHLRR